MQDELYDLCKRLYAPTIISIDNSDLLFSDGGDHLQYRAYEKYFCTNAQRLIGRKLTIHSLRHTHASLMMENGMDEQSIARRLGHTNSKVTKEIYLHVTKKMQERENQKIKSIRILNQFAPFVPLFIIRRHEKARKHWIYSTSGIQVNADNRTLDIQSTTPPRATNRLKSRFLQCRLLHDNTAQYNFCPFFAPRK